MLLLLLLPMPITRWQSVSLQIVSVFHNEGKTPDRTRIHLFHHPRPFATRINYRLRHVNVHSGWCLEQWQITYRIDQTHGDHFHRSRQRRPGSQLLAQLSLDVHWWTTDSEDQTALRTCYFATRHGVVKPGWARIIDSAARSRHWSDPGWYLRTLRQPRSNCFRVVFRILPKSVLHAKSISGSTGDVPDPRCCLAGRWTLDHQEHRSGSGCFCKRKRSRRASILWNPHSVCILA